MTEVHERLNAATDEEAAAMLRACCGSSAWVARMLSLRPFASAAEVHAGAELASSELGRDDLLEAFSHHPRLGADPDRLRERFSAQEQAGVAKADEATLAALQRGNAEYEARFGFVFLVCASGKGADEILDILEDRIDHDPEAELRVAAAELAQITHLRLDKLAA